MLRPYDFIPAACLGCEARERLADVAVAQPLQRAITQLAHPLTRHAQHAADLLERVLPSAVQAEVEPQDLRVAPLDRKSTRLNSSHPSISYAVFCLKKKKKK